MQKRIIVFFRSPFSFLHLWIVVFIFFYQQAGAQLFSSYRFRFHTYNTNDGLVHNSVKKCLEDKKGFLWIITENGLSRFDGFQFRNFQNDQQDAGSLPYNDLNDIAIDSAGGIWLATDKGLFRYDQVLQRFIIIELPDTDKEVQTVTYDPKTNNIWFCTRKGLCYLNADKKQVHITSYRREIPAQPNIYPAMLDSKQRLWLPYVRNGYACYDTKNDTFHIYEHVFWPTSIHEDRSGKIWVSTWDQGYQLHADDGKSKVYRDKNYDSVEGKNNAIFFGSTEAPALTPDHIQWVVSNTNGIRLFDKDKGRFIQRIMYDPANKGGINTDFNWHIYNAPDSTLWICTWRGITKVNRYEQQFFSTELSYLNTDSYNLITAIVDDPLDSSYAWVSAEGSGLILYNKKLDKPVKRFYDPAQGYTEKLSKGESWINSLFIDRKKRVWGNTFSGLVCIEKGEPVFFPLTWNREAPSPRKILYWKDKFLIASWRGVILFDPETKQYTFYRNEKDTANKLLLRQRNVVTDILSIGQDQFICATNHGLSIFNAVAHTFTEIPFMLTRNDSIALRKCHTLQKIGNTLYIGTGGGLVTMDLKTFHAELIGRREKIFKLIPASILADRNNNLWIYTSHGLFQYDTHTRLFEKFTTKDGLYNNSDDPVKMFAYKNDIYIGYRMAYTRFDPSQLRSGQISAKAIITDVLIRNDSSTIDPGSNNSLRSLSYKENNLTFNFTATNFSGVKVYFNYRLKGFDTGWFTTALRTVTYNNMGSGKYIFEVKVNEPGSPVAAFSFRIDPPFWKTMWFMGLMILIIATILVISIQQRIHFIRKQADEKTRLNALLSELELKALRSQMNPHFIFNSLNSIQKFIWDNKQEEASNYLNRFSKLMRLTLDNSMNKYILLEKEIETIELYLELEHRRSNNKFDYTVIIAEDLLLDQVLIQPMLIQPYLENAIWHGLLPANRRGKLVLSVSKKDDSFLLCEITDNGIGRKLSAELNVSKQKTSLSYGMKLTENRLLLTGENGITGKVIVEDMTDADGKAMGTKIIIDIPVEFFQKIG